MAETMNEKKNKWKKFAHILPIRKTNVYFNRFHIHGDAISSTDNHSNYCTRLRWQKQRECISNVHTFRDEICICLC